MTEPLPGPDARSALRDDDLSREVYCVLGVPIDPVEMAEAIRSIEVAIIRRTPFLISTPNLNFLIASQSDPEFRESLVNSDLCPPDGISIVWIARLLGIPITGRTAGSDIFEALKAGHDAANPLKVFFFGGAEGAAVAAQRALNASLGGLQCVGTIYPGFCSVGEMSAPETIDGINKADADFLVAALGARKGQLWLARNHHRLRVPVRAHLGAVLNFEAGTIDRAPRAVRKLGLEWLWRIKEEPVLWRRYWNDGVALLRMLGANILPLMIWNLWKRASRGNGFAIRLEERGSSSVVALSGAATRGDVDPITNALKSAIARQKDITIDLSDTHYIDARILGLHLMLRKRLNGTDIRLTIAGLSTNLTRLFRLHGLSFLLRSDETWRNEEDRRMRVSPPLAVDHHPGNVVQTVSGRPLGERDALMTKWFWTPRSRPDASLRLYCFAHAGAGASAFASWMAQTPPSVEIAAVQLPGREARLDEEPMRSFVPAAEAIAVAIQSDARAFALFGHSAGGRLAIHVASNLESAMRRPLRVFISSSPISLAHRAPIHRLDSASFVRGLAERYGPLPALITQDPDVWPLFERALRADFEALETDTLIPRPLDVPLTVIGGRTDAIVAATELVGWQAWSTREIHQEIVEGDHFSYRQQPGPYLDVIAKYVSTGRGSS